MKAQGGVIALSNKEDGKSSSSSSGSSGSLMRDTLNGVWILDKNRGKPSMRGYLETMNVHELAIEANEKGDSEHDTIHDMTLTGTDFTIKKLSRVNDFTLTVKLNEPTDAIINGNKKRTTFATSEHLGHVKVESTMPTLNGMARVTDTKTLEISTNNNNKNNNSQVTLYKQELHILNEATGKNHTTIRYFLPHSGEIGPTALTARDTNRKKSSNNNNKCKSNEKVNQAKSTNDSSQNDDSVPMDEGN